MAKPYFKKSHKAWYANINGSTVKLGRTEAEAYAVYARMLDPSAPEAPAVVASPATPGALAPAPVVTGPTLSELVDKFCAHVTANSPKGTVQSYTRYARRWAGATVDGKRHGDKPAASIIGADITAAADKLYPKAKGGKPRIVYLTDRAFDILSRLADQHPEGALLQNRIGRKWSVGSADARLRVLEARTGAKATCYVFRHAFCSRHVRAGTNLVKLQNLMGHSSLKMISEVYAHVGGDSADLRAALSAA